MSELTTIIKNINVIVTHPYGRAGSLFVHSLFDSHPNIVTLPRCGELHSLLPARIAEADLGNQIDAFIARCPGIFDSSKEYFGNMSGIMTGRFGFDGEENIVVCPVSFRKRFLDLAIAELDQSKQLSRRSFFVLIHIAYAQCIRDLDTAQCKYIFYHPHSNDEWDALAEDFPALYFIAMTRDPRQDWQSWKKIHALRMRRNTSHIPPICLFLGAKYYADSCHSLHSIIGKLQPDHIRIVDLEVFHLMNRDAMTHFCQWLGLEFDEILMDSTFNGHKWYGNAADLRKTSTFNPAMKRNSWRADLTHAEIDAINKILPGTISYLHYDIDMQKYEDQPFEVLRNGVQYASALQLIAHCFLHLAGNPLVAFPGLDQEYTLADRVERRLRNIAKMNRTVRYAINLAGQLKGENLRKLLSDLAANEHKLIKEKLPAQLFLEYYANKNAAANAGAQMTMPVKIA